MLVTAVVVFLLNPITTIRPAFAQSISNAYITPTDTNGSATALPPLFHWVQQKNDKDLVNQSVSDFIKEQKQVAADKKKAEAEAKAEKEAAEKQAALILAQQQAAQKAADDAAAAVKALDEQRTKDAMTHSEGVSSSFSRGNDYVWGNCTWYVANRRAVPPTLGNARDWYYNAQQHGMLVGDTPKIGAVAWKIPGYTLGHVAVVESINPDGSFTISEMNAKGLGVIDYALITNIDTWKFIY